MSWIEITIAWIFAVWMPLSFVAVMVWAAWQGIKFLAALLRG